MGDQTVCHRRVSVATGRFLLIVESTPSNDIAPYIRCTFFLFLSSFLCSFPHVFVYIYFCRPLDRRSSV